MSRPARPRIEPGPTETRSMLLTMAVVFVAAFAIRLLYVLALRTSPFFQTLIVDSRWHDEWSRLWAAGQWNLDGQAFFRAPLYSLWLAGLYVVFGHELLIVRIIQAALGALSAALIAGTAWRIAGKNAARWAGGIAAAYGTLVFFDGEILSPNLLAVLLSGAMFCLAGALRMSSVVTSAALLGLAGITRPDALLVGVAGALRIWGDRSRVSRERRSVTLCFAGIILIPAILITLVNWRVEGTPVFIASQGGVNFYAGNNPAADGRGMTIPELSNLKSGWADFVETSTRLAEKAEGRSLNSAEVSSWWTRRGLAWIATAPFDAVNLTLRKIYFLLNAYEIPNNRDAYVDPPFPLGLLLWKTPFLAFPFGLVFPLAVMGFLIGLSRKDDRDRVRFLAVWIVLYGASLVPFFICARFRVGLLPPLIVLAGYAVARWKDALKGSILAAGLLALVVTNTSYFNVRLDDPIEEQTKIAVAMLGEGKVREGRERLERLQTANPQSGRVAYVLGLAYVAEGRDESATGMFRKALEADPDGTLVLTDYGWCLIRLGKYAEAVKTFERLKALDAANADARVGAGAAAEGLEDWARAAAEYEAAVALNPDHEAAYVGLGMSRVRSGDAAKAIEIWRRGAERLPRSFDLRFNLAVALGHAGRRDEGIAEIDRALALRPDDPEALKIQGWLKGLPGGN